MRTLFELGWTPLRAPWADSGFNLGQETRTLTQEERNRLVNRISEALKKVKPLEDLIAWSADHDPELKMTLGDAYTRFWALSNSIAPLFPTVREVLVRMSDPDPKVWTAPSSQEQAAIDQWVTGVEEMSKIVESRRRAGAPALPPGTPSPPGFPVSAAPSPTGPAPSIPVGPSSTEIALVGGGIALGLGAVLFLLFS